MNGLKYYHVPIKVVMVGEDAADAKRAVEELVQHILKTGADSNLPCPEEITVGEATLEEES